MKCIVGYTDRISAAPGDTVRFMVSSEDSEPYRADIVRLISGDLHPEGAGFKEEVIETAANGDYPGRKQVIHAGSFDRCADCKRELMPAAKSRDRHAVTSRAS